MAPSSAQSTLKQGSPPPLFIFKNAFRLPSFISVSASFMPAAFNLAARVLPILGSAAIFSAVRGVALAEFVI
jgi:hypothetical protein